MSVKAIWEDMDIVVDRSFWPKLQQGLEAKL